MKLVLVVSAITILLTWLVLQTIVSRVESVSALGGVEVRLETVANRKALVFTGPRIKATGKVYGVLARVDQANRRIVLSSYRIMWVPSSGDSIVHGWPVVVFVDELPKGHYDVCVTTDRGLSIVKKLAVGEGSSELNPS